jgi:hypothetical protein
LKFINSTVLIAAPDFNLTTLPSIKLEFDIQNTTQDVYLKSQITRASAAISSYCGRIFAKQTYEDTYVCRWGHWMHRSLQLRHWPIVPDTIEIVRDGSMLVEGDDFEIDMAAGIIRDISIGQAIQVTYEAGWILPGWDASGLDGDPLPPEIEQAAILQILANRQSSRLAFTDRDPFLRSETVEGVGTLQYSQTAIGSGSSGAIGGISSPARDLLAPYVIPVFA